MNIAPYKVAIVLISDKDEKQKKVANELYETLTKLGIDTILDDRKERAGVKFNDMDLIGIPIRITVGKKVEENKIEIKERKQEKSEIIEISEAIERIKKLVF